MTVWLTSIPTMCSSTSVACQGYANLLRTMCHTQGIPAFNANGELVPLGGHAWDYVCADSVWYVSDPTNNAQYKMAD